MTWEAKLAACQSTRTLTDPAAISKYLADRGDAMTLGCQEADGFKVQKLVVGDQKSAHPSPERIEELARAAGIKFEPGMEERVQPFWASDERVDRDGDIIRQNWELAEFLKNPIILFGHNWASTPIGVSLITEVRDRVDGDFQGRALFMLPMFAMAEQSEEADRVFRLVRAGFLKTGSVGFFPMEIIIIDDAEERADLGLGRWGVIFNRSKLIEFSMVSVPANPGAHTLSAVKALTEVDVATLREFRRLECVAGLKSLADYAIADARLANVLAETFTFEPLGDVTKPIMREAIRRVVEPLVSIDEVPDWDGPNGAHDKERNGRSMVFESGVILAMLQELNRRKTKAGGDQDKIAHLALHLADFGRETPDGREGILAWVAWAEGTPTVEEFHTWLEGRGLASVLSGLAQKAFPNEHACRIRPPGDFQEDSFRRITRETDEGKEFAIIIGRLEGEETTTAQAFRYPISDWTEAEARDACTAAEGILFEPAEPAEPAEPDEDDEDPEEENLEDPETEEEKPHDDDEDDDKKALAMFTDLVTAKVAAEVARQLAPLKSQLQSLQVTLSDVRRLLEEQGDRLEPTVVDPDEEAAPADAAAQAYGVIMNLDLEPTAAEE